MGWWGGGWGNAVPQSGRDVAKAFYAGKPLKRSSCRTDGRSYWFLSSGGLEVEIARRVPDEELLDVITDIIQGGTPRRQLEFCIRGWRTQTTARHLNALGLKAECRGTKNPRFWVNGRYMPDDWSGWFTVDDVKSWPTEDPEVVAAELKALQRTQARAYRQGREFVQMTAALPF